MSRWLHLDSLCIGFYEIDVGLPDLASGMRIMSIGDLDNDKLNDLVLVDKSGKVVTVYYYDNSMLKYDNPSSFTIDDEYTVDSIIETSDPMNTLQDLIVVASKIN